VGVGVAKNDCILQPCTCTPLGGWLCTRTHACTPSAHGRARQASPSLLIGEETATLRCCAQNQLTLRQQQWLPLSLCQRRPNLTNTSRVRKASRTVLPLRRRRPQLSSQVLARGFFPATSPWFTCTRSPRRPARTSVHQTLATTSSTSKRSLSPTVPTSPRLTCTRSPHRLARTSVHQTLTTTAPSARSKWGLIPTLPAEIVWAAI